MLNLKFYHKNNPTQNEIFLSGISKMVQMDLI